MGDIYEYSAGRQIDHEKPHPCGSKEFEVLRIGADFKIKCLGCEHVVIVPRSKIEKNIKNVKPKEGKEQV